MREDRDMSPGRRYAWVWAAAVATFVLAALTGALYRYAIISGATFGLSLTNIRHAHSHLMYFGWATPVLMAGAAILRPSLFNHSTVRAILIGVFVAAAASYPMFLIFGYEIVAIGSAEMPISVIVSSLNMLAWYAFVIHYARSTRGVERDRSMLLFDLSLTFLVLATLGAWMLALLKPLGIQSDVWTSALTHIFLDLFSEGWFVLGLLAMMYGIAGTMRSSGHWSIWLIVAGLPVTFALGMPRSLVPDGLATLATAGSLLVGLGLLTNAVMLWKDRPSRVAMWLWRLPLALLGIKAVGQIVVALTPGIWWTSIPGLRILYLHVMLLGFLSIGVVAVAQSLFGSRWTSGASFFAAAVILLLLTLLPLSALFPVAWKGRWVFELAAFVAPLPAIAAAVMVTLGIRSRRPAWQQ